MLGPGETYSAKNQDVKTHTEGFDQCPLFHAVFLIVLGVSMEKKKAAISIATSLKVLEFYGEKKTNH